MEKLRTFFENAIVCKCTQAFAALCMAFTLFGLGFTACCLPTTTALISNSQSAFEISPYDHDTLVRLAEATRAYTVEGMAYEDYCAAECKALDALRESGRLTPTAQKDLNALVERHSDTGSCLIDEAAMHMAIAEGAAQYHESLALTPDAVSHLDDVHAVVFPALFIVAFALILSIASIAHLTFYNGRRQAGLAMLLGAFLIIVLILAALVWALTDFDGIFAWMHSLFFANGTWQFSYQSLLICMYPETFWVCMGVTWLLTTLIASGIVLAFGFLLTRNKHV